MKLLSTVATLFLSAALVIAAGPIKARQGCSGGFITFDGPNFTGNQQTVNGGNQCVSDCHLSTALPRGLAPDINGLAPL